MLHALRVSIAPAEDSERIEGEKRQYVPVVVNWVCPQCKQPRKMDLTKRYLMYPVFGEPFEQTLYCDECDCESTVTLQLNLQLVIVEATEEA